jgi:hypothetical protein
MRTNSTFFIEKKHTMKRFIFASVLAFTVSVVFANQDEEYLDEAEKTFLKAVEETGDIYQVDGVAICDNLEKKYKDLTENVNEGCLEMLSLTVQRLEGVEEPGLYDEPPVKEEAPEVQKAP